MRLSLHKKFGLALIGVATVAAYFVALPMGVLFTMVVGVALVTIDP
jgi:hypothetical protein